MIYLHADAPRDRRFALYIFSAYLSFLACSSSSCAAAAQSECMVWKGHCKRIFDERTVASLERLPVPDLPLLRVDDLVCTPDCEEDEEEPVWCGASGDGNEYPPCCWLLVGGLAKGV